MELKIECSLVSLQLTRTSSSSPGYMTQFFNSDRFLGDASSNPLQYQSLRLWRTIFTMSSPELSQDKVNWQAQVCDVEKFIYTEDEQFNQLTRTTPSEVGKILAFISEPLAVNIGWSSFELWNKQVEQGKEGYWPSFAIFIGKSEWNKNIWETLSLS